MHTNRLTYSRERIQNGEIDTTFIITHRMRLEDAPQVYRTFRDGCVKVVNVL